MFQKGDTQFSSVHTIHLYRCSDYHFQRVIHVQLPQYPPSCHGFQGWFSGAPLLRTSARRWFRRPQVAPPTRVLVILLLPGGLWEVSTPKSCKICCERQLGPPNSGGLCNQLCSLSHKYLACGGQGYCRFSTKLCPESYKDDEARRLH